VLIVTVRKFQQFVTVILRLNPKAKPLQKSKSKSIYLNKSLDTHAPKDTDACPRIISLIIFVVIASYMQLIQLETTYRLVESTMCRNLRNSLELLYV